MGASPPVDSGIVDTSAALASLYQAPFAEFVARRAALVSQLKKSGHKEVAASLATAVKPSRAAYLVNQVYWRERASYDAVLDAGTAARAAQQARLLGDASTHLPDTLRRRDEAVAAATAHAEHMAAEDGGSSSETVIAQVRASFEALAAHGREARLAHGHLTADVELPGMAAFAGLILASTAPPPVRRFEVVARRAEPPAAPEPTPDPRVVEAEARLAALRDREQAVTERAEELARGLGACRAQVEEAEAAAAAAARQLEQARAALAKGEAAQAAAQRDLEQVRTERAEAESALTNLVSPPDDGGGRTTGKRRPTAPAKRASRPRR